MDQHYLSHFGILGMHWGTRKPKTIYKTPKFQDKFFKKRASQNIERRIQENGLSRVASVSIETAKGLVMTGLLLYGAKKIGSLIGSKVSKRGSSINIASTTAEIYSKSLGRLLTSQEILERGL